MMRVFLVDDEPFILEGLGSIIDWKKYNLEVVGGALNGVEALEAIKKCGGIDILITDITMPKMSGLVLIENLKELGYNTKFIVLSGYNDFQYVKEGIKLGIENYLLKPINTQELISTLENTVEKIQKSTSSNFYTKQDMEILKDNILYRWLTDRIDSIELKERSKLLNINLNYSYYTVITIKMLCNKDNHSEQNNIYKSQVISKAYDLCNNVLQEINSTICFCDPDGNMVIVCGWNTEDIDKEGMYDILNKIHLSLLNNMDTNTLITIGNTVPSYLKVSQSYKSAKKLQEYKIIHRDSTIIDSELIKMTPIVKSTTMDIDYETLSMFIITGKKDDAFNFINEVYDDLESSQSITPCDVLNYSIEIIFHINNTVHQFDNCGRTSTLDYRDLFSNLLELQTMDQLRNYIISIVDNSIECFNSENIKLSPVIKQVLSYINKHYNEDVCLKKLGSVFNISPVYLGQLFKKETGELFTEYVNKFKLERAKQLLLNTNLKTADISKEVGFANPNYFYTQFKKYMGMSPSELRNCKS
jgi:two-component system response regulator YesN